MNGIRVECYAGHRAGERPLRFVLSGRLLEVSELDGRWYSPGASYFRVLAGDGNFYVLRHDETQGTWTLDGARAARKMSTQIRSAKPDMRRHQRILVPAGHLIPAAGSASAGRSSFEGVVTVIGVGGLFFRTSQSAPAGTVLHLVLTDKRFTLEFDCTVRNIAPNGLGVEFTGITHENEQKLKSLLGALKF